MSAPELSSFAIEGPMGSGKTTRLIEETLFRMQHGDSSQVWVLCSNFYRKARMVEAIQTRLKGGMGPQNVTTFSALVRNQLLAHWPWVEAMLAEKPRIGGKAVIFPELGGFEAAEYLFKKLLTQFQTERLDFFAGVPGSNQSLINQLVRRIRLRAENKLNRTEMRERALWMEEPFLEDMETILNAYDMACSRLRVFDNSKQIELFYALLAHEPRFQAKLSAQIKHLLVDDVDETIPAQQALIEFLAPTLDSLVLTADLDGGSRRGYLNAYPYDWPKLTHLKPGSEIHKLTRQDSRYAIGQTLLSNWQKSESETPETLPVSHDEMHWRAHPVNRWEMVDKVILDIIQLLSPVEASGEAHPYSPSDIVIVMPVVDTVARLRIQQALRLRGIPLQILTGTQRPTDNPICFSVVLILQLLNQGRWQLTLSPLEFQTVLTHGLQLNRMDPSGVEDVVMQYRLQPGSLPLGVGLNEEALGRYTAFCQWLDTHADKPLADQVYQMLSDWIYPTLTGETELADMQQLLRSLYLIPMAQSMMQLDPKAAEREWVLQVKTGMVADTPNKPREILPEAILMGTPQKVIDYGIRRPVHLWLDVSSREWSRTDHAPLYNAWVHSAHWDGSHEPITETFNQQLTRARAAHLTRTLMLCVKQRVWLYASELDDEGYPQSGVFDRMLHLPTAPIETTIQRATLRSDQVPILDYRDGHMAITAVPGAGKTFVNVELILELIEKGTPPQQILVLTYMDSAAKTLLARLKQKLGAFTQQLPLVSTIHSLAFRMITEGDHAAYLGYEADMLDIMDETDARDCVDALCRQIDPTTKAFTKSDLVYRLIQHFKSRDISVETLEKALLTQTTPHEKAPVFLSIFRAYQAELSAQGRMDFMDLIQQAIRLLENFPDVCAYYQQRFRFIIEDEAQDSSILLQRFILLLGGENANLIRTGDTNQSITTTFSAADTQVFRDFITGCQHHGRVVEMTHSGRCAPEIVDLANGFMREIGQTDGLEQAFQPMTMVPIAGKNPTLLLPIQTMRHASSYEESQAIIAKIQSIQADFPEKSIAILARGNAEVIQLTQRLQLANLNAISYSETPELNPVFMVLVWFLRVLEDRSNLEQIKQLCQALAKLKWLTITQAELDETIQPGFLQRPMTDITNPRLLQLQCDINDLSQEAFQSDMTQLMVKITNAVFRDPQHRSVGYLCAVKARSWLRTQMFDETEGLTALERLNRFFEKSLAKRRLPFKNPDAFEAAIPSDFIQVMTLHKAKGQEFDFVFMPGLHARNFPSQPEQVTWTEEDNLIQQFTQAMLPNSRETTVWKAQKQRAKIEEEARLVYVGLTRAKQGLFLSYAHKVTDIVGRVKPQNPSRFFECLESLLTPEEDPCPPAILPIN